MTASIDWDHGTGLPEPAEGRMSDSNAKQNAPSAAQQIPRGSGQRAGIVAAVGAVVMVGAIGWVLKSADITGSAGDPAQPTINFVDKSDLSAAATTLTPAVAGALIEDAQACRVPLVSMTIERGSAPPGSTIRIRSGNYVSPYFTVTDTMQRIAVPYPAPYGSGSGTFTFEGTAKGVVMGLTPTKAMLDLPGSQTLPVVWRAVPPC
jgi:hypothetical protein